MDDNDPRLQLIHQLRAVTVELDLLGAGFARDHALHPTDLRALIALLDASRAGTAATAGWLAEQLGLDASSVTALLGRLERAGYVERRRDPADGRRVLLAVGTPAIELGWAFFGDLIQDAVAGLDGFDEAELAVVRRFLDHVSDVVRRRRTTR